MTVLFNKQEAERVLYQYKDTIARIAFNFLKNQSDVEDVVQDVILKWVQSAPEFRDGEHEKAWIIRVTINICKNRLRSYYHRNVSLNFDSTFYGESSVPEQEIELMEIIMQLPEKHRIVLYLHYYEGYTLTEIGNLLNRSPNTVQTWHKHAKKLLYKKLGEEN